MIAICYTCAISKVEEIEVKKRKKEVFNVMNRPVEGSKMTGKAVERP